MRSPRAVPPTEARRCSARKRDISASTPGFYCDLKAEKAHITDPGALSAFAATGNVFACTFPSQMDWIKVNVQFQSGRYWSGALFDAPNQKGGAPDVWTENAACPDFGYGPYGPVTMTLGTQETCDDGNQVSGDGCDSKCQLEEACIFGNDTDGDGLDDCAETGTGQFLDAKHVGTSPWAWDTDGDGLGDGDEANGTAQGLDLPALGASPVRQDIFVEVDWMEDDVDCALHTHQFTATAESASVQMFADAPRVNPDGSSGIALHIDYGQGAPYTGGDLAGNVSVWPWAFDSAFEAVKLAHFAANRVGYFHYVVSLHSLPDAGGVALLGGAVMKLAQAACACPGYTCGNSSDLSLAEVFLHELGHNLGLEHGGDDSCNSKPNYPSIMSYRHSYYGVDVDCDDLPDGALRYSTGSYPMIDEAAVDEFNGTCGGALIDWNGDNVADVQLKQDLNSDYDATCGGEYTQLHDFNDWQGINLHSVTVGEPGGGGPPQVSNATVATPQTRRTIRCFDDALSIALRKGERP